MDYILKLISVSEVMKISPQTWYKLYINKLYLILINPYGSSEF